MTRKRSALSAPIDVPNWRVVLGFKEPGDRDWGAVRAAQVNAARRYAPMRAGSNLFAYAAVVWALRGEIAPFLLYGWLGAAVLVQFFALRGKMTHRGWTQQTATQRELHAETVWSTLLAVVWAAAAILFTPHASKFGLLTIFIGGLGASFLLAINLAALPLATLYAEVVIGTAFSLAAWRIGAHPLFALISVGAFLLVLGTLRNGRQFVVQAAAQQALVEKTEVVSLLLKEYEEEGGDWMWQTDAAKCLTHVSPRLAVALGMETDAIEAKPLLQILAGAAWETGTFAPGLRELAEKLKRRESFSELVLPVDIGGEIKWWELSGAPRQDERGVFLGFRGVGSDVTTQRRSADKISHLARFDTLTGLPNRLQVTEALGEAMAEADRWRMRCAFMMIDLDRFKSVNDTLGHPVGDRLLTRVAERLKSLMTANELCGRLGGDEFAVVIREANEPARLSQLAQRIITTLSQPYEVDEHTIYIGASVGVAMGPRDGRTVEMLTRSADLALYRSKDQGGGSHNVYEPQLHVHAEERRVLEMALRKALELDQFHVNYQPVVSVDGTTIESFEALVRWTHPELGPVSPGRFIPVAEDARLIAPIGDWVLRTACREAMTWPSTVRVAVNVSADQLTQASFVSTVMSALAQSGLPPRRLELEVTESVFMREGSGAVQVLEQLIALGVRLSLDDFGTGYSSLGYLSRTKFDTIKVDRSFVQAASKNAPEAMAIIRAVVALAESLGMSTTAEGVETEHELTMIRALGCRKIQGYLFGRPMSADDARALFVNNDAKRA